MLLPLSIVSGQNARKGDATDFSRLMIEAVSANSPMGAREEIVELYGEYMALKPPLDPREVLRFYGTHGRSLVKMALDGKASKVERQVEDLKTVVRDAISLWEKREEGVSESKVIPDFCHALLSKTLETALRKDYRIDHDVARTIEVFLYAVYQCHEFKDRRKELKSIDKDDLKELRSDSRSLVRNANGQIEKELYQNIRDMAEDLSDPKVKLAKIVPSWTLKMEPSRSPPAVARPGQQSENATRIGKAEKSNVPILKSVTETREPHPEPVKSPLTAKEAPSSMPTGPSVGLKIRAQSSGRGLPIEHAQPNVNGSQNTAGDMPSVTRPAQTEKSEKSHRPSDSIPPTSAREDSHLDLASRLSTSSSKIHKEPTQTTSVRGKSQMGQSNDQSSHAGKELLGPPSSVSQAGKELLGPPMSDSQAGQELLGLNTKGAVGSVSQPGQQRMNGKPSPIIGESSKPSRSLLDRMGPLASSGGKRGRPEPEPSSRPSLMSRLSTATADSPMLKKTRSDVPDSIDAKANAVSNEGGRSLFSRMSRSEAPPSTPPVIIPRSIEPAAPGTGLSTRSFAVERQGGHLSIIGRAAGSSETPTPKEGNDFFSIKHRASEGGTPLTPLDSIEKGQNGMSIRSISSRPPVDDSDQDVVRKGRGFQKDPEDVNMDFTPPPSTGVKRASLKKGAKYRL
uniref:Predicted protein n=1 Tax=Hordeum vulgare subsp. vulgare TaxID=112509 RepID=F2DXV7_HORVV|nr:predicted protein [Hordeum vulgare subsp. vulgare]